MRDSKFEHDMERLAEARQRAQRELQKQQQKIDERFNRIQARLERRFAKAGVTQQRIIEAALELLKEGGLENLTQRKLALKLDVQAPALYWHFKNKEELIDYMAQAILEQEFKDIATRPANQPWQEWLIQTMMRLRTAMLAYPEGARVVAGARLYPAIALAKLSDVSIGSLHSAGIDLQTARRIVMTTTTYTFGYVIEEQAAPTAEDMAAIDIPVFLAPYPYLAGSLVGTHDMESPDDVYLAGLRWIVAGASAGRA